MTASVGFSILGSSRSSMRTSPGAWRTTPRMGFSLRLGVVGSDRGSVAAEDLLGDGHRRECLGPAGIEREVCDRLDQLLLRGTVVLRQLQVVGELLGVAAGGQRGDGDQAALFRGQLRAW